MDGMEQPRGWRKPGWLGWLGRVRRERRGSMAGESVGVRWQAGSQLALLPPNHGCPWRMNGNGAHHGGRLGGVCISPLIRASFFLSRLDRAGGHRKLET